MRKVVILNFKGGIGKIGLDQDLCRLMRKKTFIEADTDVFSR